MPAKKQTTAKVAVAEKADFKGYAADYLTDADKAAIKKSKLTDKQLIEWAQKVSDDGYKFSISYTEANGGHYQVSLYGLWKGSPNGGYSLSGRHSDLRTAMLCVHHLHETANDGGKWRVGDEGLHDW